MYRFLSRYAHEKQNQWEDLKQTINLPLIGDFGQEWSYSLREEVNNSQMLELPCNCNRPLSNSSGIQ